MLHSSLLAPMSGCNSDPSLPHRLPSAGSPSLLASLGRASGRAGRVSGLRVPSCPSQQRRDAPRSGRRASIATGGAAQQAGGAPGGLAVQAGGPGAVVQHPGGAAPSQRDARTPPAAAAVQPVAMCRTWTLPPEVGAPACRRRAAWLAASRIAHRISSPSPPARHPHVTRVWRVTAGMWGAARPGRRGDAAGICPRH